MKVICAGYPKTGSKSCSAALRKLGYNVADYMETAEFLSGVWLEFYEGKATIEKVLAAYDQHGFDANQDLPGNMLWEELYDASPRGTKVILTIRESDERWWKSWCGFLKQEMIRWSKGNFSFMPLLNSFQSKGYLGRDLQDMDKVVDYTVRRYLSETMRKIGYNTAKNMESLTSEEFRLRQAYRKHNAYVQSKVPAEDLLVWKVKEGWEPLCKFLNCPIPETPIPHDNRTGDTKFIEEYAWKSDLMIRASKKMQMYLLLDLVKCGLVGYGVWKTYQTSGEWLTTKISFLTERISSFSK